MQGNIWFVLLGGSITLIASFGVRWWQFSREMYLSRATRFIELLDKAASESSSYWLIDKLDPIPPANVEQQHSLRVSEFAILGLQTRIDGFLDEFYYRLDREDYLKLTEKLGEFRNALTGGDFLVSKREADKERAKIVQVLAGEVEVALGIAIDRAFSFGGIRNYMCHRPDLLIEAARHQKPADKA